MTTVRHAVGYSPSVERQSFTALVTLTKRITKCYQKILIQNVAQKPDLMFVMVAGNSIKLGLCVVMPISIDPDHLSTSRSILI